MRTLKTEVEKGSMWTAVGHGLVGPKTQGNSVSTCAVCPPRSGGRGVGSFGEGFAFSQAAQPPSSLGVAIKGIAPTVERESGQYSWTGTRICLRQRNWTSRRRQRLREEFSFLFNSQSRVGPFTGSARFLDGPGIGLTRDRAGWLGKRSNFWSVRSAPDDPWKSKGKNHFLARPYS